MYRKYLVLAVAWISFTGLLVGGETSLKERWFYFSTDLLVDKNIDDVAAVFHRAAQAGFNGVVLTDSKFALLSEMPSGYFANVERVKKIAAQEKIQIIPAVFPIGYSESLLANDPNLAEGLPVKDALFVVKSGSATLVAEPAVGFKGDDLKDFSQWRLHDDTVVLENGAARMTDPMNRNARFMQPVKLHPFRQYHISVEVKTQDYIGTPKIAVFDKNEHRLNYIDFATKPTQDWTVRHVVFNSLDNTEVSIYFGCWEGKTGSVWWRNPKIEETALVNLLRRDGAPLEVKRETGEPLVEGKDFEKVVDLKMGTVPWKGEFQVWHQPPVIRTSLPDGTRLRVSFYHPAIMYDGQVMICPSEPKTVELLRDQAKRMHAAWGAKGYFMSHDEIRVLNWDKSCEQRHLDAGAILADNVKTCAAILREVNPGGDIYVWSDMFAPHHNAHADYYLVRGDLKDSWLGLDKDIIIVLWGYERRVKSFQWFSDHGNRMLIAGYYDSPLSKLDGWLDAAKGVDGVIGVMYTTWKHQYGDLEKFSENVSNHR